MSSSQIQDKPKKKTFLDEILNDWKELSSPYSLSNRNSRGANKFAKLNPKSRFAVLTKKLWGNKWLGLNDEKKDIPLWDKYSNELEYQSQRIINELMDENGIITTANGIKLVTENVSPYELVHQMYNIYYSDPLLPIKDIPFRDACGPMMISFFENINFEGSYNIIGSNVEKGDVVVDVGAGYGLYALLALKLGASKCYCFEPNENARQILLKNRALNGYTSEEMPIYSYALTDKKKTAVLYTKANTHCTGVIKDKDPDSPLCRTHETTIVNCITLDDFIRKLDEKARSIQNETGLVYEPPVLNVIKINVNGDEDKVIAGGSYFFSYFDKLPDITMTIYKTPDLYKHVENRLEFFNPNYHFRLRVAKLHAMYSSNLN